MVFQVKVVTPAQYQTWLNSFNNPADELKAQAAATALQQELATGVSTKPANTKFGR
jgi:heme/copper-type cytochrome/quinol oxidase subunit 2